MLFVLNLAINQSQGIIKVIASHPEGGMSPCTKFHDVPIVEAFHLSTVVLKEQSVSSHVNYDYL